jgi:hypothetical protein
VVDGPLAVNEIYYQIVKTEWVLDVKLGYHSKLLPNHQDDLSLSSRVSELHSSKHLTSRQLFVIFVVESPTLTVEALSSSIICRHQEHPSDNERSVIF